MTPKNIVYFDLETQRTANDVGGWDRKRDMGMSVGVTYSTGTGEYSIFSEKTVDGLVDQLRRADLVVGFNILHFDYEVLMGYTVLDLPSQLATLDLMLDIEKASATASSSNPSRRPRSASARPPKVSTPSSGGGRASCKEIAEYCCYDVKVTKLVHEHGCQNGELFTTTVFPTSRRSR